MSARLETPWRPGGERGAADVTGLGTLEGIFLQPPVRVHATDRLHLGPSAVGLQLPRELVVGQLDVQDLLDARAQIGVEDRDDGLDATVPSRLRGMRSAEPM